MEIDDISFCGKCKSNKIDYKLKCCGTNICVECKSIQNTSIFHPCFNCKKQIIEENYEIVVNFAKCKTHPEEDLTCYFCMNHFEFLCEKCMSLIHMECPNKLWTVGSQNLIRDNLQKFINDSKLKLEEIEKNLRTISDPMEMMKFAKDHEKTLDLTVCKDKVFFKLFDHELLKYSLILNFEEILVYLQYFERNQRLLGFLNDFNKKLVFVCNTLEEKKHFFDFVDSFLLLCYDSNTNTTLIFILGIQNIALFEFSNNTFTKISNFICNNFHADFKSGYKEFFENFLENSFIKYSKHGKPEIMDMNITDYEIFVTKPQNYLAKYEIDNLKDADHRVIFLNSFVHKFQKFINFPSCKYIHRSDFEEINFNVFTKKYFSNTNFFFILEFKSTIFSLFYYMHNPKTNFKQQYVLLADPFFSCDTTNDPFKQFYQEMKLNITNNSIKIVLDFSNFNILFFTNSFSSPLSYYITNNERSEITFIKVYSLVSDLL